MATFTVQGPFDVPATRLPRGRIIRKENAAAFWEENEGVALSRGCYVFAIRAARGFKPIYVGKATKSFKQEVFTDHKRNKYNDALASQVRGSPVLFLVCLDSSRGRVNQTAMEEAESFLIQAGLAANGSLLNEKKTAVEAWSINGVLRSSAGRASIAAKAFKRCFNL